MVPNELIVHDCGNGLLWEFYKEKGFGQAAVRTVNPGEIAGGHRHPNTEEWWLIFRGAGMVYLEYPNGIREMVYVNADMGPKLIPVPAGTGHDIHNIGEEPLAFIFFADKLYDPNSPDKEEWFWHDDY